MKDMPVKDYLKDRDASMELVRSIRQYYARVERSPKVWVEETRIPYGGKERKLYSVRSDIVMRVPK